MVHSPEKSPFLGVQTGPLARFLRVGERIYRSQGKGGLDLRLFEQEPGDPAHSLADAEDAFFARLLDAREDANDHLVLWTVQNPNWPDAHAELASSALAVRIIQQSKGLAAETLREPGNVALLHPEDFALLLPGAVVDTTPAGSVWGRWTCQGALSGGVQLWTGPVPRRWGTGRRCRMVFVLHKGDDTDCPAVFHHADDKAYLTTMDFNPYLLPQSGEHGVRIILVE